MPEYCRRLPHFDPEDRYLFLTWRLADSLPARRQFIAYPTAGQAFVAYDRMMDRASCGPHWLADARIAGIVTRSIRLGESERHFYDLIAWVVMPKHVHLLVLPQVLVPKITRWLKSSTARAANRILRRTGQRFWQDESYDHYLRNADQLSRTIAYIEHNPVSAGLVDRSQLWPYSSASQAKMPAPPEA